MQRAGLLSSLVLTVLLGITVPHLAFAARTISDVSINSTSILNGGSVFVSSGSTPTVSVSVDITNKSLWNSTGWAVGTNDPSTYTCVDTPNTDANGTATASFNIEAPKSDGSYNLYVRTFSDGAADGACATGSTGSVALSNAIVVDTVAPTVALTSAGSDATNKAIEITATFSEPVGELDTNSIVLKNATLDKKGVTASKDMTVFTFSIQPNDSGAVAVYLNAGAARDRAGNASEQSSVLEKTFENKKPVLSLCGDGCRELPDIIDGPITIHMVSNIPLIDVTTKGIDAKDGTIGEIKASDDLTDFAFTFTPNKEGKVSVSIAKESFHSKAGNPTDSIEAGFFYKIRSETKPTDLTATVSSTVSATNSTTIPFTIVFSNPVLGFVAASTTISNGTVQGSWNESSDHKTFTFNVTPDRIGFVTVTIPIQSITDTGGKLNNAEHSASVSYDTRKPRVSLCTSMACDTSPLHINGSITIYANFTLGVIDMRANGITASNATISDVTATGNGMDYTFVLTPKDIGEVVVSIEAGKIHSEAGNENFASNALSFISDSKPESTPPPAPTGDTAPPAATSTPATTTPSSITIRGMLWNDKDSDGIQSKEEAALSGWEMSFVPVDEKEVNDASRNRGTATTQADGTFSFVVSPKDFGRIEVAPIHPKGVEWTHTKPSKKRTLVLNVGTDTLEESYSFGVVRVLRIAGAELVPTSGDVDKTHSVETLSATSTATITGKKGTSTVEIPPTTVISKSDGSDIDTTTLSASDTEAGSIAGLGTGKVAAGALQWGIPGAGLVFSNPITVTIFVGTKFDGQTLQVFRSPDKKSGWTTEGIVAPGACTVTNGTCSFQATRASYYAATSEEPASTPTPSAPATTNTSLSANPSNGNGSTVGVTYSPNSHIAQTGAVLGAETAHTIAAAPTQTNTAYVAPRAKIATQAKVSTTTKEAAEAPKKNTVIKPTVTERVWSFFRSIFRW